MPDPIVDCAKVPAVALPLIVTVSPEIAPLRASEPDNTAVLVVSYTLLLAVKPLIVTGAWVILAVNGVVTPLM